MHEMHFDDFYQTVGVFGRYQKVKYFLICLTFTLPPIMVYSWSFSAATPSFRCRTPLDDMSNVNFTDDSLRRYRPSESHCQQYQKKISINECQRCFEINERNLSNDIEQLPIKRCNHFVFDRNYYQSTLVEEV
jgi:hypothetical protein